MLGGVHEWPLITPDQFASQNIGIIPISRHCISVCIALVFANEMFAEENKIQLLRMGRLYSFLNVDVDFRPPFFTISVKDNPFINVFDEMEWAVNNDVLVPAAMSVCFTYLETICVVTVLCS